MGNTKYDLFLRFMPKTGKVLDLGCGMGSDSIHFQEIGYDVLAVDKTDELLDDAKKNGVKKTLRLSSINDFTFVNEFDGIWADESLLKVPSKELNNVLKKCGKALKNNGVFYCSFLYSTYQGDTVETYYKNQTEDSILSYLKDTGLVFASVNMSDEVKKDHTNRWLNAVLVKTGA